MSRLKNCFVALKEQQKKALIPFITAGDPSIAMTETLMHCLVKAGADIIELGVPFSDPMADGPVIQKASERALSSGTTINDVLDLVRRFREKNTLTPVVLMGYINPIEATGYEKFMQNARAVGVDGLLTVDLPIEEAHSVLPMMKEYELEPIFLIAPTTTESRMKKICAEAQGFIYYVSLKGVTGSGASLDTHAIEQKIGDLREITNLPIGVGFGIKNGETAVQIGKTADAVIVGSALVNTIDNYGSRASIVTEKVEAQIREIRLALDTI